jgi:AcrR family transcriptional regulator
MTTTSTLSGRDRAILRAVAAGGAELQLGVEPDLFLDGRSCADQSAAHHLVHAGYLAAATLGAVGQRVAATLTPAGHDALDTYALAGWTSIAANPPTRRTTGPPDRLRARFDRLDLTEVAQRAQVGKTTVYRRWGSVTRLIGDLLSDMAEQSVPRAATGSLRGDLRANAELGARTLSDPRQGRLFRAVIAASLCDAGAAEALRLFYRIRVQEWSGCVRDAVDRGELAPDTDCSAVVRAVSAPLYYRMLTTDLPLDLLAAHQTADAAWVTARSGVLGSAGSSSSTAVARPADRDGADAVGSESMMCSTCLPKIAIASRWRIRIAPSITGATSLTGLRRIGHHDREMRPHPALLKTVHHSWPPGCSDR